ncbi:ankyrin repeat domain-containing protein 26 isoform X2 [Rhinolophus sinicus]|uniref:ankyrin repeat domain-containing protein 26 isoform X2 n=1 Tax=Rhinolophus sinicus TaxID=89399 RepID=UPI003D7A4C9C
MKKIFGFGNRKGKSPLGSLTSPRSKGVGMMAETGNTVPLGPGYHIRDKDLGKIHKAASLGDVAKVQQLLLLRINGLNDRDRMNRTALHLACAGGHLGVVTLLTDRKCELNLRDNENRTALMKAIQCQEEECVSLLLECGADPNIMDIHGNTALHYSALGWNIAIAVKLLQHQADMEARNKDDLTPLLLAVRENNQQMVEFLVKRNANIHAVDKMKSNHKLIFESKEERRCKIPSENSNLVDECSEEDSVSSLSKKPGIDDSWPTSDDEDFDFDTKNVMKPSLAKLMTAVQQSQKNIEAKYAIVKPENKIFYEDNKSHSENEDLAETLPKPSKTVQGLSHPDFPSPEPLVKPPFMPLTVAGLTKEEATQPAIGKKENGVDIIESAPQEQTNNDNLTYVDAAHKSNRSDKMSALGLEEEDVESPWDSESFSASLPQKYVDHFSGAADQRGKNILTGQVADVFYIPSCMSGSRNCKMAKLEDTRSIGTPVAHIDSPEKYPHLKLTVEAKDPDSNKAAGMEDVQTPTSDLSAELDLEMTSEGQESLDGSENNYPQFEEEKKHESSEMEVTEHIYNAAADDSHGLIQERKSGKTDDQQFPIMENEDSDRSAKKTSNEEIKVKEQMNSVDDLDDLTQSSETVSEHWELPYSNYQNSMLLIEQLGMDCKDSVSLLKIQDAIISYERLIELRKNHCELLTGKIKKMENKVSGLQKELSETKEMKSQLEHQKVEWEQELCNLRFTLQQEKEKRRNTDMLYKKIREQLRKKEEQYSKEVDMKQQLEITLRTLDMELKTVRNNFNQVVEELNDSQRQLSREQNARILQDGILTNLLCKQKEVETAHKKMNSEVSESPEKDLLHENRMLQDEIAMLKLEIDTTKNQKQEMEKKYFEDIAIVKEKNDHLQKTIKLNEETLTKTIFQYNGQLNVLTAENTMLNSKLESEKQNKERLETEVESYRSRLAAAIHDHEQSQTSRRDLELAFQRARDEWFRLRDKMNFDMSNLKDNNEVLSQQLSKAESKFNSLEIELHHTRDALRERTSVLEHVQRDLSQTQCKKKEIEHMYQNEQDKVNKYIGKQESLEERFSHLQSENMLLRQQLDDAHNKSDNKEKTVINIQDQFQDIIKILRAESEKQGRMLEERNKELIKECNHLKERISQYETDKAEREVVIRQLQQELADTLKKQSMSEASLEVISRYRMNLEDEAQDLKKKLNEIRNQLLEANDRHTEAVRYAEKTQDHMQKLETENAELKVTIEKQAGRIEQLQRNLLCTSSSENEKQQLKKCIELKQSLEYSLDEEMKKNSELEKEITRFKKLLKIARRKLNAYENGELCFPGDLKPNQIEVDIQINMLKQKIDDLTAKLEITSSERLRLDEKNQFLQQELLSMKGIQKKCEKLENKNMELKQELFNLKSHIEMNMIEYSEVELYKQEIEERARQEVVEKLKEVNLFLQAQAASQENLEQLRENNYVSMKSQMELRIKDLESELSKMKSTQEDSNKIELEKYKLLYLEELKVRKSLATKLNKTNDKLAEISTQLLVKERQNTLLSTALTRPVLELPCVGSFNTRLLLSRNPAPRENLVISTSTSQTSNDSMEAYLTKVSHIIFFPLGFTFLI